MIVLDDKILELVVVKRDGKKTKFEEEIAKREKVESPTVEELRLSLLEQLDNTVFLH